LNSVAIARRLECPQVLIPQTGAALSAAGALLSDLTSTFSETFATTIGRFDRAAVNAVLGRLEERCRDFIATAGSGTRESTIELWAEARYPQQVWQLDVPLEVHSFDQGADVARLGATFHSVHREVFAINDETADVEVIAWHARARCRLRGEHVDRPVDVGGAEGMPMRQVYFAEHGRIDSNVVRFETMPVGAVAEGPAIVESSFTTIVIDPGARATRTAAGTLSIVPGSPPASAATLAVSSQSEER
jgi:N-methylhydantoinase A